MKSICKTFLGMSVTFRDESLEVNLLLRVPVQQLDADEIQDGSAVA